MYLEPIFASPDIKDQLPVESRKFDMVGRTWRRVMRIALDKPWVRYVDINFVSNLNIVTSSYNLWLVI